MHRSLGILFAAFVVFLSVAPVSASSGDEVAPAVAAAPAGHPLGLVPVRDQAARATAFQGPLVYHSGGTVELGTSTPDLEYALFWGTDFSSTYQSLIGRYLGDVAAASGATTNVYASDTQYYQTVGGITTHIKYNQAYGGSWQDTTLPTSNGCSSTAGGPICVSDAQVQAEVAKGIAANGWQVGMKAEVFVFLENGMSTCSGSACAFTVFCAYHAHYVDGANNDVLYANMPYTGHNLAACGSQNAPNGDAAADATINVTSHEANETVTDGLGNAWFDRLGRENGDKCAYNFGAPLGGTSGSLFNQVINGNNYYLQQEWSNHSRGCVQQGT